MDDDSSDVPIVPFKNLFIIEGRQIFDFVQATILKKSSPICQIVGHKTSVYQIPGTGDYICVTEDNDLDQSALTTELLTPWLEKAQKTFIFSFQSAYTYNTDKEFDKRCFIRSISNIAPEVEFEGITAMEDCNIVYGVSAGGKFEWFFFTVCHALNQFSFVFFSFNLATHSQIAIHLLCRLHGLCTGRFVGCFVRSKAIQ